MLVSSKELVTSAPVTATYISRRRYLQIKDNPKDKDHSRVHTQTIGLVTVFFIN